MAIMSSPKRTARVAGLFYVGLLVFSGFAWFGVRQRLIVPGDAAATAADIAESATLFRVAFVSDLVGMTFYLLLGMALYLLLRHVNAAVAAAMMVFVALGTAIYSANLLNHLAALMLATEGSYTAGLGGGGSDGLVLLFADLHQHGYIVAQVYFGLWLLPLGYLAYKSGWFPRVLGVLLMVAAFVHVTEVLTHFLVPGVGEAVIFVIQIPAIVAEFWMIGYLLVKGVRVSHPDERIPDATVA
jgi:hypothetical protein